MAEPLTIARPYARAAFECALSRAALPEWERCLGLLAVLSCTAEISQWLHRPNLTVGEKLQGLKHVLSGEVWPEGIDNLLSVMAQNGRLLLLPFVCQVYVRYKDAHEQSTMVEVASAFPLSESQVATLVEVLKNKLHSAVTINATIDQSLLGGVYIQAGNMVLDHSIRGRLSRLRDMVS